MMLRNLHIRINRHRLKLVAAMGLLCITGLAVAATIGGEKRSKNTNTVKKEFVPIRTTAGFTLKAGPNYKGSFTLPATTSNGRVNYQTLVAYSKGNTTYILPYNYHRVNIGQSKPDANNSSTELLKVKVRIN